MCFVGGGQNVLQPTEGVSVLTIGYPVIRYQVGGLRAAFLPGALVNLPRSATGRSADIAAEAVIEEGHDLQLFMWEGSW